MKQRVLFLCATNSVHSPIAEALLERIDSQNFEPQSAGASSARLHPLAVEVMKEIGVDLSTKIPRSVAAVSETHFDYVITLDDATARRYASFRDVETIHWKIDDPVARPKDLDDPLREFRMVRDQIAQRLRLFVIVHVRPQKHSARTASFAASAT